MNQIEIGKLIAKARKEKGYTQQELANLLFVTDKAVSKWERGLSLPDSNMFLKVSHLLDLDIEDLIPSSTFEKWSGYIKLDEKYCIYKKTLGCQTVFEHLVSLFALLSIKDIYIDCDDIEFVKSLHLEKYFNIYFNSNLPSKKLVCIYGNFLLFGAGLTRWLTSLLMLETNIDFFYRDKKMLFSIRCGKLSSVKKIGRGFIYSNITLENFDMLNELISKLCSITGYSINKLEDIFAIRNK